MAPCATKYWHNGSQLFIFLCLARFMWVNGRLISNNHSHDNYTVMSKGELRWGQGYDVEQLLAWDMVRVQTPTTCIFLFLCIIPWKLNYLHSIHTLHYITAIQCSVSAHVMPHTSYLNSTYTCLCNAFLLPIWTRHCKSGTPLQSRIATRNYTFENDLDRRINAEEARHFWKIFSPAMWSDMVVIHAFKEVRGLQIFDNLLCFHVWGVCAISHSLCCGLVTSAWKTDRCTNPQRDGNPKVVWN